MTMTYPAQQRGVVLIMTLVMLLALTLLAVNSMHGVTLETRVTHAHANHTCWMRHCVKVNCAYMAHNICVTSLKQTLRAIALKPIPWIWMAHIAPAYWLSWRVLNYRLFFAIPYSFFSAIRRTPNCMLHAVARRQTTLAHKIVWRGCRIAAWIRSQRIMWSRNKISRPIGIPIC